MAKDNKKLDQEVKYTDKIKSKKPQEELKEVNESDLKYKEEIEKLKDQNIRLVAELENVRKRNEQQVSELRKYAISDFSKEVIGVLENFYLILNNAPIEKIEKDSVLKNFLEGITLTQKNLTNVLEKNGIKRIFPIGEKFDHNKHQVINQIDSDKDSGTIIEVLQAGYVLNGRLIKEAMVIVAK